MHAIYTGRNVEKFLFICKLYLYPSSWQLYEKAFRCFLANAYIVFHSFKLMRVPELYYVPQT